MQSRAPRLVLAFCSLLLAFGAFAHAKAFRSAASVIRTAQLPSIYGSDFKALWLSDSTTLLTVAALFAAVALRPSIASRTLVFMIALIPAATAIFIYIFVGAFYAGHLLLGTAVAAVLASFRL